MNRRNFLSLIPALSATPFIAKELVQEGEDIKIIKPELIKTKQIHSVDYDQLYNAFKNINLKLLVVHEDQIIAEGLLTEMSIETPPIQTSYYEKDKWREYVPGPSTININGQLYSIY